MSFLLYGITHEATAQNEPSPYPPVYSVKINGPASVLCYQGSCLGIYSIDFYDNNGNIRPRPDPYYLGELDPYSSTWSVNGTVISSSDLYSAWITFPGPGSYQVQYDLSTSLGHFQDQIYVEVGENAVPIFKPFTNVGLNEFTLNWYETTGATGYQVDISSSSVFDSFVLGFQNRAVTGASLDITGLTSGTRYYCRLRGVYGQSISDSTETYAYTNLAPPSVITATNATPVSFVLSWGSVTGASGYEIDLADNEGFVNPLQNYNSRGTSGTSETITGLSSGVTYWYRLRSSRAQNFPYPVTSANSTIGSITTLLSQLIVPVALPATDFSPSSFVANWNIAPGATGYRLDISRDESFLDFVEGYRNLAVAGTSKLVTGVPGNVTYWYRVRSEDAYSSSSNSNVIVVIDNAVNFVRSFAIQNDEVKEWNQIESNNAITFTSYFDGFGLLVQSVVKNGSPESKDIVQPIEYNDLGIETKKYLPYTVEGDGSYRINALSGLPSRTATDRYSLSEQFIFYQQQNGLPEQFPFTEAKLDSSPLNRIEQQGAAGEAWQLANDKTITKEYSSNTSDDVYKFHYSSSENAISEVSLYDVNTLFATKTLDEKKNAIIEYKDKGGNTICKKVQSGKVGEMIVFAATYYIYDNFGDLVMVLPPEAVLKLTMLFNLN